MDRLLAMQTFVRVVETGSFSAVARQQNSTQSTVSKQVAALEEHLGAKLIVRTTRSLALTEDGTRYFEEARRLVAEIHEVESQVRTGEQQLKGVLRVAASVGFGLRVLMPHVQSFLREHPNLKIDWKLNDGFVDLIEHGIDVAIRIGQLSDSTLIARRIGTTRRVLVASKEYIARLPAERPVPKIPDDLRHHPCIVFTETAQRNMWDFSTPDGSSVLVRINGPLQTNSSEVIRASVLGGIGVAYSPIWLFDDLIASGDVVRLLPDWGTQTMPIHLVYPPERRHAAKVRAFSEHIAQAFTLFHSTQ